MRATCFSSDHVNPKCRWTFQLLVGQVVPDTSRLSVLSVITKPLSK